MHQTEDAFKTRITESPSPQQGHLGKLDEFIWSQEVLFLILGITSSAVVCSLQTRTSSSVGKELYSSSINKERVVLRTFSTNQREAYDR